METRIRFVLTVLSVTDVISKNMRSKLHQYSKKELQVHTSACRLSNGWVPNTEIHLTFIHCEVNVIYVKKIHRFCFPPMCCWQRPKGQRRDNRWGPWDDQSSSLYWLLVTDYYRQHLQVPQDHYISKKLQTPLTLLVGHSWFLLSFASIPACDRHERTDAA